jgi:electron transfer flavoprotein alpha subunit
MRILVLAENTANEILQSTRSAIAAAMKLGDVDVLVVGEHCRPAAEAAAKLPGVAKVLQADAPHYAHRLAEPVAELLVALARDYSHILAPATASGKNILPRVAALLDVQILTDVTAIEDADTFVRPIYAGSVLITVKSADAKKVLTVRVSSFEPIATDGGSAAIETTAATADPAISTFLNTEIARRERPDLTSARVVISGGRGLGSAEHFHLLDKLADLLNAAIGASRAAVDAGYAPNDLQVGQTGKIVAPDLYVAIGISGAIQHLAGMKDSKVIVAINKDPDAPIFQVADYGWVADLFEAIPEMEQALAQLNTA